MTEIFKNYFESTRYDPKRENNNPKSRKIVKNYSLKNQF